MSAAVLLVLAAMLVHSLAFSTVERSGKRQQRFEWNIVGQYLFSERVLRGGSLFDLPWSVRVSHRLGFEPELRKFLLGFRCAGELNSL